MTDQNGATAHHGFLTTTGMQADSQTKVIVNLLVQNRACFLQMQQ
jgi:hypothetical protein